MSAVPPPEELRARLEKLREKLDERRLRGAIITDPVNVRYLSGFTGNDSALLITRTRRWLLTDFRYVEEARGSARGWKVVQRPPGLHEMIGHWTRKLSRGPWAFEPEALTCAQFRTMRKAARRARLRGVERLVAELRLCKSAWEVGRIEAALRVQEEAFRRFCRWLKPGVTEREAAAELRYRLVKLGADDQAFEIICQWGPDASRPHGQPGARRLREDDLVLVDWGAKVGGYHSDLTRTFFLGSIPPRLREIHAIVAEAQARAKSRVGPDVPFAEVDKAARGFIRKSGWGRQFGHSTGHGLGLCIHEAPRLSAKAKGVLKAGMVVTVEPGIYLPGVGGVRIEDDVLVTERGRRVLSRLPISLRHDGRGDA